MTPFEALTAIAAPLLRSNVDTDAIIPSREMRSVTRSGLADGLFASWRYQAIGSREENPNFILNTEPFRAARILVSGPNFGCGSSREHAVWALAEYGFRAVIAPSFNPIFRNNCIANGVVPVVLDEADVTALAQWLAEVAEPLLTVDLEGQMLRAGNRSWSFDIDSNAREMLLLGLDPIQMTLREQAMLNEFRNADRKRRPWAYAPVAR